MTTLNVQIVPAPAVLPEFAHAVVQLPARGGQGDDAACRNCDGGVFGRHREPCRKCGGTGRARFVEALRFDVPPNLDTEVIAYLDALGDDPLRRIQRTVVLHESGGGYTNTGAATIVAGLDGDPLPAMYGRAKCGADHATFYVSAALVVHYSQWRGDGHGTVELVGVDRQARHYIGVEQVLLARFGDEAFEVMPALRQRHLAIPCEAIDRARAKARDYHCRSAYYVASGGARGPSGALTGAGAAAGGMPSPLKGPGIGY